MIVESTFVGDAGNRHSFVYKVEYVLPYRVEFYQEEENIGYMYYVNLEDAEEAAQNFAFKGTPKRDE